jgi:hypothetical protein
MKGGEGTGYAKRVALPILNMSHWAGARIAYCGGQVIGHAVDPEYPPGTYTGPNRKLGDYYIREIERLGSEHRQVVRFEIVGTGRIEQMPRSRFDRQARPT